MFQGTVRPSLKLLTQRCCRWGSIFCASLPACLFAKQTVRSPILKLILVSHLHTRESFVRHPIIDFADVVCTPNIEFVLRNRTEDRVTIITGSSRYEELGFGVRPSALLVEVNICLCDLPMCQSG